MRDLHVEARGAILHQRLEQCERECEHARLKPQAPLERLDSLLRPVRLVGVDQLRNLVRVRVRV